MRNFYEILGVRHDATNEEIMAAYRKRVLETHPDRGGSSIEFQNVLKGYKILSDPILRKKYDEWLLQRNTNLQEKDCSHELINKEKLFFRINWILNMYCDNFVLKNRILAICKYSKEIFLNLDTKRTENINAAIVLKRILIKIGNDTPMKYAFELDHLLAICNCLIDGKEIPNHNNRTTNIKKQNKRSRNVDWGTAFFVCCVAGVIALVAAGAHLSKEADNPNRDAAEQRNLYADATHNNGSEYDAAMAAAAAAAAAAGEETEFAARPKTRKDNYVNDNNVPNYNSGKKSARCNDDGQANSQQPTLNTNLSYSEVHFSTGDIPYKEHFGRGIFASESLSELTIENYSNNDAVVLLCTLGNNVIRNVFVGESRTYTMKYIPEGKYVVKIMYGKSWNKEKNNGVSFPNGGFMRNVHFSMTGKDDLFDYTFERHYDGISYPTYSITLHKVRNGNLQMDDISQSEFFY